MRPSRLRKIMRRLNYYPPLMGAGISIKKISENFRRVEVQMKMRWYNRNIFGTHFGGSLYAMCDPFYVFIVAQNFGSDYIVWDKSAKIDFVRPGKGTVYAVFEISEEALNTFKAEVDTVGKKTFWLSTEVLDGAGEVVARVEKEIYARKKNRASAK